MCAERFSLLKKTNKIDAQFDWGLSIKNIGTCLSSVTLFQDRKMAMTMMIIVMTMIKDGGEMFVYWLNGHKTA